MGSGGVCHYCKKWDCICFSEEPISTYQRIILHEKNFTINDLRADLPAQCVACAKVDKPLEKFILEISRKTQKEDFYCLDCWDKRLKTLSWIGIHSVIIFTEKGINCGLRLSSLINKIFGSPFACLKAVENGFVLYSNDVKVEQLCLF